MENEYPVYLNQGYKALNTFKQIILPLNINESRKGNKDIASENK